MSINSKGCAQVAAGKEKYEQFKVRGKSYFQYDYRTPDGELFSCCGESLEMCRARRDAWLNRR